MNALLLGKMWGSISVQLRGNLRIVCFEAIMNYHDSGFHFFFISMERPKTDSGEFKTIMEYSRKK